MTTDQFNNFLQSSSENAFFDFKNVSFAKTDVQPSLASLNSTLISISNNSQIVQSQQLHADQLIGTVFRIQNATLNDSFSLYQNIRSNYGSAIQCYDCKLHERETQFVNNSAIYDGGSIYLNGIKSFSSFINLTFTNHTATNGGCISLVNSQNIQTLRAISFSNITVNSTYSTLQGGFLFANDLNLEITIENSQFQNSSSLISGGVIQSKSLSILRLINSTSAKCYSKLEQGSVLSSNAVTGIDIRNLTIDCQDTWTQRFSTNQTLINQLQKQTHFRINSTQSVNASFLSLKNCIFMRNQSVFLISNVNKFIDNNSTYQQIHSLESGIYQLENLDEFVISNGSFRNISTNNSAIIKSLQNVTSIAILDSFIDTINTTNGGGLLFALDLNERTSPRTVEYIVNGTTIRNISTLGQGSVFYLENKNLQNLNISNTLIENVNSSVDGIISIKQMKGYVNLLGDLNLDVSGKKYSNVFRNFSSNFKGAFIYSEAQSAGIRIFDSLIQCQMTFIIDVVVLLKNQQLKKTVEAPIFANRLQYGLETRSSVFQNCLNSSKGGVMQLNDTNYSDFNSTFRNNYAYSGGMISCSRCVMLMNATVFNRNQAEEGGIMSLENDQNITLLNTNQTDSYAKIGGGIRIFKLQQDTIISNLTIRGNLTYINNSKANYGGLIHASNPTLKIAISDLNITNTTSFLIGGIFQIADAASVIIQNCQLIDFQSLRGGLIYSESKFLNFQMLFTNISCMSSQTRYDSKIRTNRNSMIFVMNAPSITFKNNTVSKCINTAIGGLMTIENTTLSDTNSTYVGNQGKEGGVITSYQSVLRLTNCNFTSNQAVQGGVFSIYESTNLYLDACLFWKNIGSLQAGVLYSATNSIIQATNSIFRENRASKEGSVFYIQALSMDYESIIDNCTFIRNTALQNTMTILNSLIYFINSKFLDNTSSFKSKNLMIAFSSVLISNCTFNRTILSDYFQSYVLQINQGSYVYVIYGAQLQIEYSSFENEVGQVGGAIAILGESTVYVVGCLFKNNAATYQGGAIYGSGIQEIQVIGNTIFNGNIAQIAGDDIYITNSLVDITISDIYVNSSISGRQSMAFDTGAININNVTISNFGQMNLTETGAAMRFTNCLTIFITNSKFYNTSSLMGGAIYITEQDYNKNLISEDSGIRYFIRNSTFENCTAVIGGAIFIDNAKHVLIEQSNFTNNKALDTQKISGRDNTGSGGAIYFTCDSLKLVCKLNITTQSRFIGNKAAIKGGAVYWDIKQPDVNFTSIYFQDNKAGQYGDNITCFPQQIVQISEYTYRSQLVKLGLKTPQDFQSRLLQEDDSVTAPVNDSVQNSSANETPMIFNKNLSISNLRSGGIIPGQYFGLIDMYGQLVGSDFDSKITVLVNSTYNQDPNANKYPPVIEGKNQFESIGGVYSIESIVFDGSPGFNYSIILQSDTIDVTKESNKQFMQNNSIASLNFNFEINLRECELGEQFTEAGKCILCQDSFLLEKQTSPGTCIECPVEKAICNGGANIGPKSGYWRFSNQSSNIISCLYSDACLGMREPENKPIGECDIGYQGILCADCALEYSRNSDFRCGKCPGYAINIVRLVFIILGISSLIIFMIRSTLQGAKDKQNVTNIYIKILLNHFQLILMTSSFDFNWTQQILDYFRGTGEVATFSTQVFSIDCFLDDRVRTDQNKSIYIYEPEESQGEVRIFFQKLIMISLMPFLLSFGCLIGWYLVKIVSRVRMLIWGKVIASIVILLFLLHPSIVQYMFYDFKCKDVDGQSRLLTDLEIMCWDDMHKFFSFYVALPSIVLWGLGIPFFALIIMIRLRHQLNEIKTREKFGFLYRGYRDKYYYWEIVIMYRKILIIFIAVFINNYGAIAQALVIFIVIVITIPLNNLETLSLITSLITIYCGLYFIVDQPQTWIKQNPDYGKGSISLSEAIKQFFFGIILFSNILFFLYWCYKMSQELRSRIRDKLPRIYLCFCLCFNKKKLEDEQVKQKMKAMNDSYKQHLMNLNEKILQMVGDGSIVLNEQTMEKLQIHFDYKRILTIAGSKTTKGEKDRRKEAKNLLRYERVRKTQSQKVQEDSTPQNSKKKRGDNTKDNQSNNSFTNESDIKANQLSNLSSSAIDKTPQSQGLKKNGSTQKSSKSSTEIIKEAQFNDKKYELSSKQLPLKSLNKGEKKLQTLSLSKNYRHRKTDEFSNIKSKITPQQYRDSDDESMDYDNSSRNLMEDSVSSPKRNMNKLDSKVEIFNRPRGKSDKRKQKKIEVADVDQNKFKNKKNRILQEDLVINLQQQKEDQNKTKNLKKKDKKSESNIKQKQYFRNQPSRIEEKQEQETDDGNQKLELNDKIQNQDFSKRDLVRAFSREESKIYLSKDLRNIEKHPSQDEQLFQKINQYDSIDSEASDFATRFVKFINTDEDKTEDQIQQKKESIKAVKSKANLYTVVKKTADTLKTLRKVKEKGQESAKKRFVLDSINSSQDAKQ